MDKSAAIMDLVAGYDAYTAAGEIAPRAIADAPATTPVCAVAASAAAGGGASWLSGQVVSATMDKGC